MKLSARHLSTAAFILVLAALIFWPKRADPEIMRGVACTADAFAIMDHFRLLGERGDAPDEAVVALWRDRWDRLNKQVSFWRRSGRAEPAYLAGLIVRAEATRDDRVKSGDEQAWLAETMAKVENCSAD